MYEVEKKTVYRSRKTCASKMNTSPTFANLRYWRINIALVRI